MQSPEHITMLGWMRVGGIAAQSMQAVAPGVIFEYFPSSQVWQASVPFEAALNLPGTQLTHAPAPDILGLLPLPHPASLAGVVDGIG